MMHSAAHPLQIRPRGSNHVGMRQYNERVVLHAIRLHGDLPKADLARLTHLSTQTVSLIVNKLLDDQLLIKCAPLRGRIGQPSVPIALNPDGAFAIGIKIGRRSMDVLLIDFTGNVRQRFERSYAFPDPRVLFDDLQAMVSEVVAFMQHIHADAADRLTGVGVAAPLSLGGWQALLDVPAEQAQAWNEMDLYSRIQALPAVRTLDLPVHLLKDTAAACTAELVAGRGHRLKSFLYLFVDTFIGGGLVIDSHVHSGTSGNAGAVGSMPLHAAQPTGPAPAQVLSQASLLNLQRLFSAAGLVVEAALDERALQAPWLALTERWLGEAAQAIALSIANAACLLDLEHVILDGVFNRALLAELIAHTQKALDAHSWEGVTRPTLHAGTIGSDARALGGALLPLHAAFAPDPEVFLKTGRPLRR
ncbi:ROK family transcriptional regulator [Leptothrix ochracea]|uniref:ROK family transcriptional regulator n=3 Tax=Leptothrix ochracea TaxID=735331 RepID=UPI0034E2767F